MPLLEIVRTEKTSPQAILDLITVGKIIKKIPVVVGNCTGFAVNRTFFPYTQGAQLLVSLGIDLFRIDRVKKQLRPANGTFSVSALTLFFHGHVWNNCQGYQYLAPPVNEQANVLQL